jgi:spore germination cell wall hydrolase CwlJ-like protein
MKYLIPFLFMFPLFGDFDSVLDKEVIAATLILEAGGERTPGAMEAVYEVIHRRAQNRNRTERQIVLQRLQFSCWNNVERRMNLLEHAKRHRRWNEALNIVNSPVTNLTGGADHYHATSVNPPWSRNMTKTTQIGNHLFYRSR